MIKQFIESKESKGFIFKPNGQFYSEVGINRKRWGQLYRGEKDPTLNELRNIAKYFEIEISSLIEESNVST